MKGRLWEPVKIGEMEIKNRIVMAPMETRYGSEDGYVTMRTIKHYEARARGGTGLIIIEASYVHEGGQAFARQLAISNDRYIPGMSELVRIIHSHGAKVALQIHHGGQLAPSALTKMQPVAPSQFIGSYGETLKELTINDIAEIISCFREAAVRAKKAGFDGVEIHAAHGYLIDQFISRSSNKRRDLYGGGLSNRARLLIEVITAIRKAVGTRYPVWCRINGREYGMGEDTSLEEAQEIARMAQNAGADAIHVSASGPIAPVHLTTPKFVPAVIADLAAEVKKAVSIPVIAVGRITAEAGETIVAEGKADLVAIGKGLLADPELPNKAASRRFNDIRPCILCLRCLDALMSPFGEGITCTVNVAQGQEAEYAITPSEKHKKVLVIGGGPAGMEAARVAAIRGHQVALWEKGRSLGGQLVQAALAPHKDRIASLNMYFQTQLKKLDVAVELGREATLASVQKLRPDTVVVTTGAVPHTPDIPGLDKTRVVYAGDVLQGKAEVGNKVIVIGGELVGCETADFIIDSGKAVTVTRRGPEMAKHAGALQRMFLLGRLTAKGVVLLPGVKYEEATALGLVVTTAEGERKTIEGDTLVLATGFISKRKLYDELKGKLPELYIAGDCIEPRTIHDAIAEGYRIGLEI